MRRSRRLPLSLLLPFLCFLGFDRSVEGAARPTVTATAVSETTGSVVALANLAAEPGETISLRITVTNNDAASSNIGVSISTPDPQGSVVPGYSGTSMTIAAGASGTTAVDALRIRIRQDAVCGHRIPVVIRAYQVATPTYETFTTYGLVVGKPNATVPMASQGPLHLQGLNLQYADAAWKTTDPVRFAVVEDTSSAGTVRLRIHGGEGALIGTYNVASGGSGLGEEPVVARGNDGWGVAYGRSGNVYFRKFTDAGSWVAEQTLATGGTSGNIRIAFDSVMGWCVVYSTNTAGTYAYHARRVATTGVYSGIAQDQLNLSVSDTQRMDLAVAKASGGVASGNAYSYFTFYYHAPPPSFRRPLRGRTFYFWINNGPAGTDNFLVDDPDVGNIGIQPARVRVATSASGGVHYVAYTYFTGWSTPTLFYRQVDPGTGALGAGRTTIFAGGGGDGADITHDIARRGVDGDVSVVYAGNNGSSSAHVMQQEISGTTLGTLRELSDLLNYSKLGLAFHAWLSPGRLMTVFSGSNATDGDSLDLLSAQPADLATFEAPLLGIEPALTQFSQGEELGAAAAGDRMGLFTFSFDEEGQFFRIVDRNGQLVVPRIQLSVTSAPGGVVLLPGFSVASDGSNFLVLFQDMDAGLSEFSFWLIRASDGAVLTTGTLPLTYSYVTGAVHPVVRWTGDRYRYVVEESGTYPNNYIYTGTITAAGVHEGANKTLLYTDTTGSPDLFLRMACDGAGRCAIAYNSTLRVQTSAGNPTSFSSRAVGSPPWLLGSDGAGWLLLREDGVPEYLWPDGSVRATGSALSNWTGDFLDYRDLEFDGRNYLLYREDSGLPVVQVLGLAGAPAPGFLPTGDVPLASYRSTSGLEISSDLVCLSTGEALLAWMPDMMGYGDYDVHVARASLPAGFFDGASCAAMANSPPATSAGGPYTLYIRSGGSPYVLTDGASGTNQATFQVGASGVSDADFGGRVVSAGWDFTGDGVIDRPVADGNGDGTISQAESQVVLSSAELLGFGFPTNTTTCSCPVRFYATDQLGLSAYSQLSVTMVDQVPPVVELTTPNGGEAWPGGSVQDITWAAEDNVATGGFDLAYVTEKSYLPNTPLPRALADGAYTYFYFDIPAPAYNVVDVNLDIDVRWGSPQASGNIQLYNVTTGTARWLQNGTLPQSGFSQIVGNYDRTLATNQPLSAFDGASSGSQWRVAIYDIAGGGVGTVYGLRLNIVTARTPIVAGLAGAARSYAWTLPTATSPATRVEITARDSAAVPNSDFDDSDGNFFITQPNADQVRTLVAWNESRMRARYPSYQVDAMEAKLLDFVSHAKIDGVLIDLSSGEAGVAGITAAYAAWDGTAWNDGLSTDNATNGTAANAVATAIRNYLYGKVSTLYPNLETMVFVGGDVLVPFFREADTTPLHPETNYPGELASFGYTVNCNATRSPTWAAVCANSYLSDGRYGASSSKPVPGSPLSWWLPDVAVGRLVESPDQISGLIDTYIAQDGVTIVDQALTTGYDFLADGGDACYTVLTDGLEPGAQTITRLSEFLSAWSDTQLKNQLFGLSGANASDLSFVSGHADHRAEGAAAAGAGGILDTVEMNSGTSAVPGAALVGLGCHTGLSVLPDGGPSDSTATGFQLDLAELFATKRFPAFVGNTGFGWGFTDGVGLGEKLIRLVAEEVVRSGQVSLGEALRLAKQEYFLRQDRVDDYDHKVIHESTLYGIPNYEVRVTKNLPLSEGSWYGSGDRTETLLAQQKASRIPGRVWLGDPSWTELELAPGRKVKKSEASAVGESPTASLRVMDFVYQAYDAGLGQTWDDAYVKVDACRDTTTQEAEACSGPGGTAGAGQEKMGVYLTLDGQATGEPGGAIQPAISFDTHLAGTELHGILLKGGEYVQPPELNPVDPTNCFDTDRSVALACFDPVIGTPQTKAALPEGPAPAPFVRSNYPTPFVRSNYPTPNGFVETNGNSNGAVVRWDNLNAPMGELVRRGAKGTGPSREEISTEWLYRTQEFTQYYSNSVDWTAPVFGNPTGICEPFPDWTASTAYALGEVVVPVPGNGHAYTVTVAGTTAASQPSWPTGSGATVGNGTVTFQERSLLNCYSTLTGLTLAFNVPVTDAGDGVYKVYITSTQDVDGTGAGEWTTLELTAAGGGVWTGSLPVTRTTSYLVQAVDWAGNVAVVRVSGSDIAGNGSDMGSDYSLPRQFGVVLPDADSDGMPDAYESQYPCLNGAIADGSSDPDLDYLTNTSEFGLGTGPCSADSDGGGDNDGSELNNGRSPKSAADDLDVSVRLSESGSNVAIAWGASYGQNAQMDGWWHVYRSGTPLFVPADKVGPNHPDGTTSWTDTTAACSSICFYELSNVALSNPPPTIAAIVPNSGPAGTAVSIYGSNFVAGSTVTFDGVAATGVAVMSVNLVTCLAPAGVPSGPADVKVISPGGLEGTLGGGFTYP